VRNKPQYAIESVDHALRLALLLQQEGPIRLSDAAERLGVARSTAHRLFAMLIFRGFATQTGDRRYCPGTALTVGLPPASPGAKLRAIALPHMDALVERVNESANLEVLVGTHARFIATVECARPLRVGDREGQMLPAHLVSGGKVLLAAIPNEAVTELYAASGARASGVDLPSLLNELRLIRRRGFAINHEQTEEGVTAVARLIRDVDGRPLAGLTLSIPTTRFSPRALRGWLNEVAVSITHIEADLARR
jgi:DNA-binding IclR family transcriptional regulator